MNDQIAPVVKRTRGRPRKVLTDEEIRLKEEAIKLRKRVYHRNHYQANVVKPRKQLEEEKDHIYELWKEGKLVEVTHGT